jgi:hypothetical protein
MLRAVLLIGITWTTLSFLFCLAWARANGSVRHELRRKADPSCRPPSVLRIESERRTRNLGTAYTYPPHGIFANCDRSACGWRRHSG